MELAGSSVHFLLHSSRISLDLVVFFALLEWAVEAAAGVTSLMSQSHTAWIKSALFICN